MNDTTPKTTKPAGNAPAKPPRRRAREFALQGLYQWRLKANDAAAIEAHLPELEGYQKADRDFCMELVRGVISRQEELCAEITPNLDRKFDELSPIEACILLIGTLELLQYPETPYRVIINEAIELAKTFGGSEGHKYINGVLDKIAAKLRAVEVGARKQGR